MASKQYDQGANFERAVKKYFEDRGYDATRSAGSHGIYDVIADDGTQLWKIQCKRHGSQQYAEKVLAEMYEHQRLTFPVLGMVVVLFVATDLQKNKLVGFAKRLMPAPEVLQGMLEAINGRDKKGAKSTTGEGAEAAIAGDNTRLYK